MARRRRIDFDTIRTIPIVEVARVLGLQLKRTGIGMWNEKSAEDHLGHTSLAISEKSNRWKRWSGKGEPNEGSVIDLVMACRGCGFQEAIDYLASSFPHFR